MHDKCSIYRNHSNIKACAETEQPYITYINHKSRFLNWESSKTYIQIFKNEQFGQVRVITKDGEPWFVGKDIAEVLGYLNTKDAIATHVYEEDKKIIQRSENATLEIPNRGLTIINESGLYSLILSSKLPQAKKFKKWVTSDVLPSIRKHGMYATDELINNPDLLIAAATKIKEERAARLEAEKQRDKLIHQNKLYTTSEITKELRYKDTTNTIKQHCRWVVKHKVPHPQSKNQLWKGITIHYLRHHVEPLHF
nr:MAG TPA_asm: repressor domain protein [Caudoviricetes sp.]